MVNKSGRKNRVRRDKAAMEKYGQNKRQVWHEYPAVKARLAYACNALFHGDSHAMAAAAGVCYRHMYRVLYGHSRLSINMAAQIVTKIGIRAEWLLCGVGNIMELPAGEPDRLSLPPQMRSNLCLFDAVTHNPGTEFFPPERVSFTEPAIQDVKPYEDAARVVYLAHANKKPVGFFLGNESTGVPLAQILLPFFQAQYVDFLIATLTAASHDVYAAHPQPPIDINSVARFAAERGMGYGEAIGLVGFAADADRQKSLLAGVLDLGLPALVAAEIGEIGRHTAPNIRGAEIGAAVGAAAYVDLFAYTEQLRNFFGTPGGVMIVAGECQRGVRLFLERLETLRMVEPHQTGFTFVLFSKPDDTLQTEIQIRGGHVIFLDQPTITTFSQLFQTCNDVYAGKITNERQSPDRTV